MSTPTPGQPDRPEGETYEIRLRGHLDARWAVRLGVSGLTHESDGTTTLRTIGVDQAALHGLLQRVRDLGLTLVSVIRVHAASDDASNLNPSSQRNPK
jgi:hypothetical protein